MFEHAGQPASLPGDPDQDTVTESLKNGQILCGYVTLSLVLPLLHSLTYRLINIIAPGSVKKINTSKMAFKMVSIVLKV